MIDTDVRNIREFDVDSDEAMIGQKLAFEKKCLHDNYLCTYKEMMRLSDKYLCETGGVHLELGSGGGFFSDVNDKVITSDVTAVNGVDMVIDAQQLPFEDKSIDIIYAVHVFHHIPDVRKFFSEANRCLKPGGGIILVEPYWSPVGKFFYKNFHSEPFNEKMKTWDFESSGNMSGANQALSYIVFKRDLKQFCKENPDLIIKYHRPFNGLAYIATGGLWRKKMLPDFMFPIIRVIEKIFFPLMYLFGIHHYIVIKKMR